MGHLMQFAELDESHSLDAAITRSIRARKAYAVAKEALLLAETRLHEALTELTASVQELDQAHETFKTKKS